MSMLAAPRRKQKWTLNPRGKEWSEDSNKFGQKMLEKMGWSSGKGLGAKEQGMVEHVRVRVKNDQVGIGYAKDKDDHWTEHQDDFNSFLQNLQKEQFTQSTEEAIEEKNALALSGKSLEEKSKQSQKRVHYKKFTRGKDVNKYSAKDLANIFGKKDLNEKPEVQEEESESIVLDPVGTKDLTAGVVTIKGGDMNEYFSKKVGNSEFKKVSRDQDNSESESEIRAGFGFPQKSKSKFYVNDDDSPDKEETCSKTEKYKAFGFIRSSETKAKSKKLDNLNYVFDNPCLDLNILDNSVANDEKSNNENLEAVDTITPKKRKNEELDTELSDKPKSKKKKCHVYENEALDLEFPDNSTTVKNEIEIISEKSSSQKSKKEKKSKEPSNQYENQGLDLDFPDNSTTKNEDIEIMETESSTLNREVPSSTTPKKSKKNKKLIAQSNGIENPALDLNYPDRPTPKKNKKSDGFEDLSGGIENPALDLNYPDRPTPKKNKKSDGFEDLSGGISNPGLDLDFPEKSTPKKSKRKIDVEVPSIGIVNPGLDLEFPDRPTPKKLKRLLGDEVSLNGFENPALDLNHVESKVCSTSEFEVPRTRGVENDALNLSDENMHKKRVTFNDEIEYSTDSVTKKKKKLDKYEVVNEKLKKKKRTAEPVTFVNEALDVEVINVEEMDNEINERKTMKGRRRRERRLSLLETIEEAPEEDASEITIENVQDNGDIEIINEIPCDDVVEVVEENSSKKKTKKKKSKKNKDKSSEMLEETDKSEDTNVKVEEIDLTENEGKKKKKKKRNKSESEETADLDNPGKENVCSKKKESDDENCKKNKKKSLDEDVISLEEFLNEEPAPAPEPEIIDTKTTEVETNKKNEGGNFQRTRSFKKTKDIMRSLFIKNPTLLFNGSNINEIKGYGSNIPNNC